MMIVSPVIWVMRSVLERTVRWWWGWEMMTVDLGWAV
jgi:hypothetical protein